MPSSALPKSRARSTTHLPALLLGAALALTACGSGTAADSDSSTSSNPPATADTGPASTQSQPAPPAASTSASASASGKASNTAAAKYPVTISNCGRQVTVDQAPHKAVTLNQGATEVMLALGLSGSMAGTAYLDDQVSKQWAADYAKVPVLSKEYPSSEALLAAKPDFTYASYASAYDAKAVGSQDDLSKLGIASYLSPFGCADKNTRPKTVTFDAVWKETRDVAKIFGVSDRAETLIANQRKQLDEVRAKAPGKGLRVFWFDSGDKQAYAGTGQGAPQLIIDTVGATNVFASLPGNWQDVNWENVVAADPDVIVLADASWSTAADKEAQLAKDPATKDLKAVKGRKYVVLPFSETTAGIRNVEGAVSMAEQLKALNK